ncbi:hypothetical protein V1525DRAFT_86407 [Lipomyces kononenkoae]|uniref:Uncharacterized protein n=1 Tax=Lipomyces kononenkoae TaxID=34357 RepID=A0ACC3T449_LIPKO
MTSLDDHHRSHPLAFAATRASADFSSSFSSPLASRARPVSDIIFNHSSPPSSSARRTPRVDMNALRNSTVDPRVHVDAADDESPQRMNRLAEQWLSELENYEGTLEALTASSASSTSSTSSSSSSSSSTSTSTSSSSAASSTSSDPNATFKSELNAIETWFSCVLSEPERTAALYALLQHTTQVQIRFFISVLRQMEMTRLDPAMARVLASDSQDHSHQQSTTQDEIKRTSMDCLSRDQDDVDEKLSDEARAISPIGSEKSSACHPVSVDVDSLSRSLNSTATATPTSAKFHFPSSAAAENLRRTMVDTPISNLTASLASTPADLSIDAQKTLANAEIIANTTAMKLAALSTVNNRILLDSDVRKFRRRNLLEQANASSALPASLNPALPSSPFTPLMYNKPLPSQITPNYKPSSIHQQQHQQQFMSPSPASSSSPFEPGSGSRGRRWQSQQPGRFDSIPQPAPLLFSSPGSFHPHTPSKPPQSSPSVHFQNLGLGFGIGSSPFSDWYNMSSSPAVASPVQTGPTDKSGRSSASPSLSTSSSTSTYSSSMSGIATGTSPAQSRDPSSQIPDDSLLNDIPAWLRSLRLHKYTDNLKDLMWEDLVHLSEGELVDRGVSALGARRKMLKVFEAVRRTKLGSNQNDQKDNQLSAGSEDL